MIIIVAFVILFGAFLYTCLNQILLLPSIVVGYLLFFGVNLIYHRHLSHRAYEIKWFRFPLVFLASMALQGPPRLWVITHKLHHKECDTINDPHSPLTKGTIYALLSPFLPTVNAFSPPSMTTLSYKHRSMILETFKYTKGFEYDILHKFYFAIVCSMMILLYSYSPDCIIVWLSGAFISNILYGLVNAFCHETTLNQTIECRPINNIILWPILLGGNWHKNHHDHPQRINLQKKWYELDLHYVVFKVFEKLGICIKRHVEKL